MKLSELPNPERAAQLPKVLLINGHIAQVTGYTPALASFAPFDNRGIRYDQRPYWHVTYTDTQGDHDGVVYDAEIIPDNDEHVHESMRHMHQTAY